MDPTARAPDALGTTDLGFLVPLWRDLLGSGGRGRGETLHPGESIRLGRSLLRLQRGLTGERALAGAAYMEDPELLGAYLLYYWPASFAQASRALRRSHAQPRSAIDAGCGPGPVAAALIAQGASEVLLVDSSPAALEIAKEAVGRYSRSIGREARVETAIADVREGGFTPPGRFDAIAYGHVFNEALSSGTPVELAARSIAREASALVGERLALLIEPASLGPSRGAIALRDALVSGGAEVAAPCPFKGECPMRKAGTSRTCHDQFGWRQPAFVEELAAQAGLERPELKCAWFALRFCGAESERGGSPERIADRLMVVSDPMLNKAGRVRYVCCTPKGLVTVSAKKGDPHAERIGFFSLQRAEELLLDGAERREGGLGISGETELIRVDSAGQTR
jgi:SAM-dependent methyltransferase